MSPASANGLKGVIFDLDGVIFDSLQSNVAFYDHILEKLGQPPHASDILEIIHREPTHVCLRALLGDGPLFDQAMAYWHIMDTGPFVGRLELYPGVEETLASLARRLILGVATNRTSTARPALARFGLLELFASVVTPIEAGVSKPDPLMMEMALRGMGGLRAEEVVFVGDTTADEGLALAAGVRLIAFRNPELAAWAHAKEFSQIAELLKQA